MIKKDIILIAAPFSPGSSKRGTELAPSVLCSLELLTKLKKITKNISIVNVVKNEKYDDEIVEGVRNKDAVVAISKELKVCVQKYISNDTLVLIMGGDHVISLGTIAGSLMTDENIGVIYFDAHTDINTETTSVSANAHGMHMAALMGMCKSNLNEVSSERRLKSSNVFWIGTRSVDEKEVTNIQYAENVYTYDVINQRGLRTCLDEIALKLNEKNITHLHISFDIDVMNPNMIPATGVPEKEGLIQDDIFTIMNWLRERTGVGVIDFVEYNPLLDDDTLSVGKWCVSTIYDLIKNTI